MPKALRSISFSWKTHFPVFIILSNILKGGFSHHYAAISLARLGADLVFGSTVGINSTLGWHGGSAPAQP